MVDMAKRDYYEVLGVGRDATVSQIKAAYRKLARKFHPDVNKAADAEEKFREATEAYEVLSDDKRRPLYDQFGHAGPTQAGGGGPHQWRGGPRRARPSTTVDFNDIFGGGFAGMSLEDILGSLGGGHGGPRRPRRTGRGANPFGQGAGPFGGATCSGDLSGQDVEHHLNLDFMQAVHGTTVTLRLSAEHGSETINVRIPPGVKEGSRVRVRGKGQPGPGGMGDLYIVTHVGEHPYFRREDNDILLDVPLNLTEAALGAKIDVPTVHGDRMTVTIPPGVASGQKLRLRGKGVAPPGLEPGDQFVVVKIVPPRNLSAAGKRLIEELNQTDPCDPRKDLPWQAN